VGRGLGEGEILKEELRRCRNGEARKGNAKDVPQGWWVGRGRGEENSLRSSERRRRRTEGRSGRGEEEATLEDRSKERSIDLAKLESTWRKSDVVRVADGSWDELETEKDESAEYGETGTSPKTRDDRRRPATSVEER
jgi:hypothetical protein